VGAYCGLSRGPCGAGPRARGRAAPARRGWRASQPTVALMISVGTKSVTGNSASAAWRSSRGMPPLTRPMVKSFQSAPRKGYRGEQLVQAQMPLRPGEHGDDASARLERLLDESRPNWRTRQTWRRRQLMDERTGALDPPGTTWRERPAGDRGGGVFIAGDMVAAPGLLSEVAWASAITAGRGALAAIASARRAVSGGSSGVAAA
jgi:hypothetical protein